MQKAWMKWMVMGALALAVLPAVQACGDDDDSTGDTSGNTAGDDDDSTNTTGGDTTGTTDNGTSGDDDDSTDTTDTGGTGGTDTGATDTGATDTGSTIGYVEDIQPFIQNDCLACHGLNVYRTEGDGKLLETQADVYKLKASVVAEVTRGQMPDGAPYDQATRNLFAAWRTAGYPVNRGD